MEYSEKKSPTPPKIFVRLCSVALPRKTKTKTSEMKTGTVDYETDDAEAR